MAEPWDIPPIPEHGDENADDTYKMVGRSLSEWEYLEYQLSHVYAQVVGKATSIAAMREYGAGNIFALRLRGLETAVEGFFIKTPHQEAEAGFRRITYSAARLADRRNEIAHGIVRPLQWIQQMLPEYEQLRGEKLEYALVPPLYTRKKLDERHRPKYIYTANELMQFALAFSDLSKEALDLKIQIARIRRS